MFAKVLVDNGFAINLLPRHVLDKMPIKISYIRLSTTTAKAYDGLSRPIIENINVKVIIGPHMFQVTLQVMDIHPLYNMLLGRHWIHATKAVVPFLHQQVKFIINENLVTIKSRGPCI